MKKHNKTAFLTQSGVIAALYVVLTLVSKAMGLDSGQIQLRLSEALCILPVFLPAAVPGLTVGCLLANILCGNLFWDVLFGTLATFLGAVGTRALRNRPLTALLPPIVANTLIVPFVLAYAYGLPGGVPLFMLTVGLGEVLSCGVLGRILWSVLDKHKGALFQ
ncbi:MAG: QueT transporter family protein [Clostridia bacterium]|nr:QueT transporter family protein [Clostridia bacterium]